MSLCEDKVTDVKSLVRSMLNVLANFMQSKLHIFSISSSGVSVSTNSFIYFVELWVRET